MRSMCITFGSLLTENAYSEIHKVLDLTVAYGLFAIRVFSIQNGNAMNKWIRLYKKVTNN